LLVVPPYNEICVLIIGLRLEGGQRLSPRKKRKQLGEKRDMTETEFGPEGNTRGEGLDLTQHQNKKGGKKKQQNRSGSKKGCKRELRCEVHKKRGGGRKSKHSGPTSTGQGGEREFAHCSGPGGDRNIFFFFLGVVNINQLVKAHT